ncbi:DUF2090 domain-containing protein [Patescibacteria group bacterium]|nr:DUF2090 domain-containing protein [Patescibacteria group bacterium]
MNNLFILPFDHRSSFAKDTINAKYPVSAAQAKKLQSLKRIIFDGFLLARKQYASPEELAILVDEEFGASILKNADKIGIATAQTVEKSGEKIFELEYSTGFRGHLKKYDTEFAKVLIHYFPNDKKATTLQNNRILKIQKFCQANEIEFLLEVLVDGENKSKLIKEAVNSLKKSGVKPDVWKLEGVNSKTAWKQIRKITDAPIVVLGRGADKKQVDEWIKIAAQSGAVHGMAVGRTIFLKPIQDFCKKKIDKKTASERIANNYLHYTKLWNKHKIK